jgi:hypothetical protein
MRFKEIKTLSENRHGYDDSGMSLAPGNDEGPDSWDYSAAHDRIGAGDPRRPTKLFHHRPVDVPHDVHINGRKWKTFGSKSHAENVARKLAANGKNVSVQQSIPEGVTEGGGAQQAAIAIAKRESGKYTKDGKRIRESATAGSTSAGNIATVVNPDYAYNANQMGVKRLYILEHQE